MPYRLQRCLNRNVIYDFYQNRLCSLLILPSPQFLKIFLPTPLLFLNVSLKYVLSKPAHAFYLKDKIIAIYKL